MIQTGPDADPAQLIPAVPESGEQPSPNSLRQLEVPHFEQTLS